MLAIYCRTSKNRPEKHTIDNQIEAGIKCANQLNVSYREYIDDGISGTLDESIRDGLSELFRDIKNGEITHIYCFDQTRIERDTRTWEFFVALCLNNNIKYYPGGSFFDLDNVTNRMLAQLMSIVNAYYAEITSKKVRLANAKKAKEGKTHGLKPYGYIKDENNKYKIYDKEAEIVKRMFQLSYEGIGGYTIANILNKERIPTKFSGNFSGEITRKDVYTKRKTKYKKSDIKWRGNVIHDILRNEMYKGIREWNRHEDKLDFVNGEMVKTKIQVEKIIYNDIPIIIEPHIWDAVNNNLSKNMKNVGRRSEYSYLLNGLVFCGHCQNEVVGKKRPKGNDNAYKCKGKRPPQKDCTESRGISLPKLENFIIHHLFKSKNLKQLLVEAPKNSTKSFELETKIKESELLLTETKLKITRLELVLKDYGKEYNKNFVLDLIDHQKRESLLIDEISDLKKLKAEEDNEFRNEHTKSVIESYTDEVGFDEIKRLIHTLIERIEILHTKEAKSGYFIISIKYKYYDETSIFTTNWQAMNWWWVYKHRKQANTLVDLDEDKETQIALMQYFGKSYDDITPEIKEKRSLSTKHFEEMNPYSDTFKGIDSSEMKHELIELKMKELILFQ